MLRSLFLAVFFFAVLPSPAMLQEPPSPSAPTNLSASVRAEGIALRWVAPEGQTDGYEILRYRPSQGETDPITLVDNTGNSETRYTDASATTLGEQYVYGVKSIRGDNRSEISSALTVNYPAEQPVNVSVTCEIRAGANHDILQCTVSATDQVITSALWTPSFEDQYAQTTSKPAAAWVIAEEFCGQSTFVDVEAKSGDSTLPTAETTITLACAPTPTDTLSLSCENVIISNQHNLRCSLSGGDQTIDSAQWTPGFDAEAAQDTTGEAAAAATWVISAEDCGQATTITALPSAGGMALSTVETTVSLPCVIIVDEDCSLANAIRSANGSAQVEESGDSDGNDDCEDGADPDDSATPPSTGDDIILLKTNTTLAELLPAITSRIQIEGDDHTISGDAKHRVFMVNGGQLNIHDLTISKGLGSTVGGGIYVNGGSLSVRDSVIKDSKANDIGGGIYSIDSDIDIVNTEFSGNMTVKSHGGGFYFVSSTGLHTLDIVGATFKKNEATEDGGGLKTAGGIVTINKSTFVENQSDEGGAIESSETTIDITNSTFSNNSAREGGGLSSFSSFITLTHTTWAYNSADEQGGGIAIIGWTGNIKMRNTLITDSKSGGDCHSGPNPDIVIEFTGNFIQDGSCTPAPAESQAALSDSAEAQAEAQHAEDHESEEHEAVDAMISGLTGAPPHHPLQWGSPAIDAADPLYCLLSDQPETDRPQYGNCDIGAYEYPKAPPTPATPDPPAAPDPPSPEGSPTPEGSPDPESSPSPEDNPAPPLATATPDDCIHIVSAGENLFRIAILYNLTVREISSFNNLLSDDRLSVGQEMIIPFDHCESPTPLKG